MKLIYALFLVAGFFFVWNMYSEYAAAQAAQIECAAQIQKNPSAWPSPQVCRDAMAHAKTAEALGKAVLSKP